MTEAVTGLDLIKEQIRIASGEKLSFSQGDICLKGHAMECRINAEKSEKLYAVSWNDKGQSFPGGNGIRIDSAVYNGYQIPPNYDSMIAKVIVHGESRRGGAAENAFSA